MAFQTTKGKGNKDAVYTQFIKAITGTEVFSKSKTCYDKSNPVDSVKTALTSKTYNNALLKHVLGALGVNSFGFSLDESQNAIEGLAKRIK
jgi:hypothetical protein